MIILSYLLLGFVTCLAISLVIIWTAMRRAADGYEDDLGFHLGPLPSLKIATPAPAPFSFFPSVTGTAATGVPMTASVANLQATTAAPVNTPLRSLDPIPSPLYRRHRRSGNSRPPIPVASASPFEIECAATRQRAGQTVNSTPPLGTSAKAIIKG